MRILYNSTAASPGATVATVSYSDTSSFGAVGAAELRGVPVFGPRGIAYRPCEGDNLLQLPADGTGVCAGVLCSPQGLEGGELRLYSAGGASILLRNNGDVVINGVTITKTGRIVPPEEE